MKNYILILSILFSLNSFSQEKPSGLGEENFSEGTLTKLSKEEAQKFQVWSMSLKYLLDEGVYESRSLSPNERVKILTTSIQKAVLLSGDNYYQRLVRYTLNRGLLISDYISNEEDIAGSEEAKISVLLESIKLSKKYYSEALAFEKNVIVKNSSLALSQASYGIDFAEKLYNNVMSVQSLNAQVRAQYKILEMLLWDLYKDKNSTKYGYVITYMHAELTEKNVFSSDADLTMYRELNYIYLKALRLLEEE